MDVLESGYLHGPPPPPPPPFSSYTFNFWNDYLGLSTLVAPSRGRGPNCGPNSITEALKETLGLEDGGPPLCSCLLGPARDEEECSSCGSCRSCRRRRRCSVQEPRERASLLQPSTRTCRGSCSPPGAEHERRRRQQAPRGKLEPRVCVFCRNNGAPEEVFGTHVLKAPDGRVLCPILRAYTCPLCSASGDSAHTIKYCPLSREPAGGPQGRGGGRRLKIC